VLIVPATGRAARIVGAPLAVCVVGVEELLPQLAESRIERVDAGLKTVRITAFTKDDACRACPGCGQGTDRVHSRYVRHVADESVGGLPVAIDLSVWRLYCENPACPRTTFVEQLEGLTEHYQRRTPALRRTVCRSRTVGTSGTAWPGRR
jgi:transposase